MGVISNYIINPIDLTLLTGSVGATDMNEQSSRSHAIFTITIERSEKGADGDQHVRVGKLLQSSYSKEH